jgi:hypothetical protein
LIRSYKHKQNNLIPLSETQVKAFPGGTPVPPPGSAANACPAPAVAPRRTFKVTAVFAATALANPSGVTYNARGGVGTPGVNQITDPNALMYVLTDDLNANGTLKAGVPIEPLILRAAAGDCISIELTNGLSAATTLNGGIPALPPLDNTVQLQTSHDVGLHPQLLAYDVAKSDGFNIGSNPVKTVPPGQKITYTWYAGKITRDDKGKPHYAPVEFGSVNLAPADPLMQDNFGLIGALIIEPQGTTPETPQSTRAQANIKKGNQTLFREGVAIFQDDLATVQESALNYRAEPFSYRYLNAEGILVNNPSPGTVGISRSQSDSLVSADPQTPVFVAEPGKPFRLRVLHPAGLNEQVFELHGHSWQEEPYSKGSLEIVENNPLSQSTGSRDSFGANASFDVVLKHAGGENAVQGDYLFRTFIGRDFQDGMWGLVRVGEPGKDVVTVTTYCGPPTMNFTIAGINTVNPSNDRIAANVTITGAGFPTQLVPDNPQTGQWSFTSAAITTLPSSLTVTSAQGGTATVSPSADLCPIQAAAVKTAAPPIPTDALDRFRLKRRSATKPK